ncbi:MULTISPECIES: hypothetical protein [Hungatella]|uniref:hypothetical protein n=1 Tax=Hungatella TaxID=1649459 RepID=UPI0011DE1C06|nr:hypothetical protein [Hungatella hathewayi]
MYLNEKAWEIQQDDHYVIHRALKNFMQIYSILAGEFHKPGIFVPAGTEIYLRSSDYPLEKWLSEVDIEYRRLFLSFWGKRIHYQPEEECEVLLDGGRLEGGTEAFINDSFMLSLCLNDIWEKESVKAEFFSLDDPNAEEIFVRNVFEKEQLYRSPILDILKALEDFRIYSYKDLWKRREELFPHLKFCPSVEKNLEKLEAGYVSQVVKKLTELERYCSAHEGERFRPELLTKTTPETDATLKKYEEQHTFTDEEQQRHIVSWHMRFTGISGRIFFVPQYKENLILVCYIGEKLPNVTYPT